jgi:hypothetical protein
VFTYAATIRQTVHYTNLLWERGWGVAISAASGTSSVGAQATVASDKLQVLLTKSLMLGINDAAVVLVLVLVLGAAASAVLVRAGTRA